MSNFGDLIQEYYVRKFRANSAQRKAEIDGLKNAADAKKFIAKGDKVKVTLRFRGREMAHMQSSKHILDDFAEALADVAVVEKAPKVEGRSIGMVLAEKR